MTYAYECRACGHEWEAEQRISEPPLCRCPKCEKQTARRIIPQRTDRGFVLLGRVWERDGYQRN